jgi:hypothetical protein
VGNDLAVGKSNAILEQAAAVVAAALGADGLLIAEPVAASFRDAPNGSSGVAVAVRLRDPAHAPLARRMLAERFGGGTGVDVFIVA